jgi:hypothetical protein
MRAPRRRWLPADPPRHQRAGRKQLALLRRWKLAVLPRDLSVEHGLRALLKLRLLKETE